MKKKHIVHHLDLHGLNIQQGFNKTLMFVKVHRMQNTPYVKIITGRSGKMNKEFNDWMDNPSFKPHIHSFKPFDDRGSWLLKLNNN